MTTSIAVTLLTSRGLFQQYNADDRSKNEYGIKNINGLECIR